MDTICAIATAHATAAIGVIRVSGDDAFKICDKIIKTKSKPLIEAPSAVMRLGKVYDGERAVDEVLCAVFRAPNSYTGENIVEINCHGGISILNRVLKLLISNGARCATAGEFTKRAFLNGKLDLVQAEAVGDLIHSQSALDASLALERMSGKLSCEFDNVFSQLIEINTDILAYIDFPEEGLVDVETDTVNGRLNEVLARLVKLEKSFEVGSVIKDGVTTAIIGAPNVGKSTLLNAILGYERAIVSDVAGTTRDMVSESVVMGDVTLNLCDTAGIRTTNEQIEKIGIDISKRQLNDADLVFALFDVSRPLEKDDYDIIEMCRDKKAIAVINKTDLDQKADISAIKDTFLHTVLISAANGEGISQIKDIVNNLFNTNEVNIESGMLITNLRHFERVVKAREHVESAIATITNGYTPDIASVDISSAASEIALITGRGVSDKIIDEIFSKFCVGK